MNTSADYLPRHAPVTTGEWELADLACAGLTTARIAAELMVSLAAGIAGIESLMAKLGVSSRAELVAVAAAGGAPADI